MLHPAGFRVVNPSETGCQAMAESSDALLSVRKVTVRFGGIVALDDVSFDVARGDICGLIGPNGAGKTTLFNCMSRLYQYQSGDIVLEGRSLTDVPIHRIAGLGLGRTFQNLAMFRTLTVTDNVMVGAHARSAAGFAASALRLPSVGAEEKRLRERAHEIMDHLGLLPFADRPAGDLPFFDAIGFGDEARACQLAGGEHGDVSGVIGNVSDAMVEAFVKCGPVDEVLDALEPFWGVVDSLCPMTPYRDLTMDQLTQYNGGIFAMVAEAKRRQALG